MEVETPAASTPAPVAEVAHEAVSVPTDSEGYANWRMTGKVGESKAKTEASPASDAHKAEKSETSADSETATHQESKKGKGAEDRIRELVAKNKELETKLNGKSPEGKTEAEKAAKPAESQTAKPAEVPKALEAPKKPKLADFKTWDEYEAARDTYVEALGDFKITKALQADRQAVAQEAANKEFATKFNDAKARYGEEMTSVITPAVNAIFKTEGVHPLVHALVNDSPVFLDLLYVLGSDAEKLAEVTTLARTKPLDAVRYIAEIERGVKAELGKAAKTAPATERGEDGKFKPAASTTPEKKETKAPPPAHEVGGRGAAPSDKVESAVKANDFRSFREARNQRDLASRRG